MARPRRRVPRDTANRLLTEALFRCCLCPQHTAITIEKHHVLPISEDGDSSEDNLIAVCGSCHDAIHLARDAGRQIYTPEQLAMCKRRWVDQCWEAGSSQKQRGLTESSSDAPGTASRTRAPIARFLAEIGMPGQESEPRSRFLHLPDLYLKPKEYDRILSILEEQHAVIVVGEPHMGKTYTALRILWEHFLKGRRVVFMTRDVLAAELHRCSGSVDEFASRQLHEDCTLCLDDPFGETEYRPLGPIQKDLLRLLHAARQRQRCAVIITTRLGILGEALNHLEGADSLGANLRAEIRVHTSYSQPVLREVLRRYVRLYEPPWAGDRVLRKRIVEQAPKLFEAPHNIEVFVRMSVALSGDEDLLAFARRCRQVLPAIRDWINHLSVEEQAALLVIRHFSEVRFLGSLSISLGEADGLALIHAAMVSGSRSVRHDRQAAACWEETVEGLRDVVVALANPRFAKRTLALVHPIYTEALDAAVDTKPGVRALLMAGFEYGTAREDPFFRASLGAALAQFAHHLGDSALPLLRAYASARWPGVRSYIAGELAGNTSWSLPGHLALLDEFAADGDQRVREEVAAALGMRCPDIDPHRRETLVGLAGDTAPAVRAKLALQLGQRYPALNDFLRAVARRLAGDPAATVRQELSQGVAAAYATVDEQGRELVARLLGDSAAPVRAGIATGLAFEYASLDEPGRAMVRGLSGDARSSVRSEVASGLANRCEKLDAAGWIMLGSLAADGSPSVKSAVATGLASTYRWLNRPGRALLHALCADPAASVREAVADGLASDYADLPRTARVAIAALARDRSVRVRVTVADGLAHAYQRLDAVGRDIVLALSHDHDARVRAEVAGGLSRSYSDLDPMGRLAVDHLLEDRAVSVRKGLASGLAFGFPDGDPVCLRLLHGLSKDRAAAVRAELGRSLGVAHAYRNADLRDLVYRLRDDSSPRVRAHLLEGLRTHPWDMGEEARSLIEALDQ